MRICFVGDSFVNGVGDDDGLGWAGRLCATARRSGHDVTRYDLGVRGNTSAQIAERWEREVEARLRLREDGRVVFSFGSNDGVQGIDPLHTLAHADAILSRARSLWPSLMVGPLPVGAAPADVRIDALCRSLATLSADRGVPYLRVYEVGTSEVFRREAALDDGAHPNRGGYAALADTIAAWEAWTSWFPRA